MKTRFMDGFTVRSEDDDLDARINAAVEMMTDGGAVSVMVESRTGIEGPPIWLNTEEFAEAMDVLAEKYELAVGGLESCR